MESGLLIKHLNIIEDISSTMPLRSSLCFLFNISYLDIFHGGMASVMSRGYNHYLDGCSGDNRKS